MSDNIEGLLAQVNTGIAAIKSEVDGVKAKVAQSAEQEVKLSKIAEDVAKAAEAIQAQQLKSAAIEAAINRIGDASPGKGAKSAEAKAALREYLVKGDKADIKGVKVRDGEGIEIRAMSTTSDPDGGYLVIPEIADFMAKRLFETSPIRSVARVVQTSSKSLSVTLDDGEAGASWEAEGASASNTTTPQVGTIDIVAHALKTSPQATIEMLEDGYFDVESWLTSKVADKLSRTENAAFVSGNGVGKPFGFMGYDAWASAGVYEAKKIEQVNLGHASTLTADGLIGLQGTLKEGYQANAKWLMHRTTFAAALKLKGSDNYFFNPVLLRDGQLQMQLLGKPVVFCSDIAEVAANALSVAYGDFAQGYTILDRVGLSILRDPYSVEGKIKFVARKRVGGAVTGFDAIKIGKVAA